MSVKRLAAANSVQGKAAASGESATVWSDTRLVQECLRGDEAAWSALIDKYKNLIFSIPIKYGFSPDDASEIFQAVCVEMLSELPNLRKPKALPKWLIQVTAHKCFHQKQQVRKAENREFGAEAEKDDGAAHADSILTQAEEEQLLRESVFSLPPRCRELIRMLFFEEPAQPYDVVASELGLAVGSIGFIRQRCLERLRRRLMEAGFS